MTVRVAARALLYNKSAESGLVGQVFREDENKRFVFFSRITVPLVDYANEYTRFAEELSNAEPGNYFMQLLLPNGKVMTKDFEITPDKPTPLVFDLPHKGPANGQPCTRWQGNSPKKRGRQRYLPDHNQKNRRVMPNWLKTLKTDIPLAYWHLMGARQEA